MIKLKSLLLEKLPADLKKDVGNVLFGQTPDVAALQKRDMEPNTKWENSVFEKIQSWTDESDKSTADFFLKNKDKFEILRKEFPEIIDPPVNESAYRGTTLEVATLRKALPTLAAPKFDSFGDGYFVVENIIYKPHLPAQSWSTNKYAARDFGNPDSPTDLVQVIYKTKVNNEFVFNPEFMNIVYGMKEDEVVRVGNEGKFTALINAKNLNYTLSTHLFKQAKPFFNEALIKYNKKASKDVSSWNKILADYDNIAGVPTFTFKLYKDAADAFIKSLK